MRLKKTTRKTLARKTMIHLAPGPTYPAARGNVYLPIVVNQVDPALAFYDLMLHDVRQQRPRLEVCEVLQTGAMRRAFDLAHGEPWAHRDSTGLGSNGIARGYGCALPESYSSDQNYIESLTAGMESAQVAFDSLARSDHHKMHLFGEVDFYRAQIHVGVGYCKNPDAPYQYYWCIWIAECLH